MPENKNHYELEEPVGQQFAQIWTNLGYFYDPQKKLSLTLCVPPNQGQKQAPHYPVILYAEDSLSNKNRLSALLQFTAKGYAIALLDPEGSESDPIDKIMHFNSAARFLMLHAWKYSLDPNRIIAMGEGTGGYTAAGAVLSIGQQKYSSEDAHTLPVNFRSCICISGKFAEDNSPRLPELKSKRKIPPFLLMHGENDQTIDFVESEQFCSFLEAIGQEVSLYKFKSCPHAADAFFTPYVIDILSNFIFSSIQKSK